MSRRRRGIAERSHAFAACLLLATIVAPRPPVGAAGKTVWDGVYVAAQAERGQELYLQRCSACHGDFLDGTGGSGPALSGTTFADNWDGASLNDLFVKIGKTMPRGAPGTLRSAETLDLVAYLLQSNGFPRGSTALADTSDLALIDIVGRDGPRPLRIGSGVRTVGCLSRAADDSWTLMRASALVRTRNPAVSTGFDADRARAAPLGSKTIRLTNVKREPQDSGSKVEVKGALAAVGAEEGITVLSLQVIAPVCD